MAQPADKRTGGSARASWSDSSIRCSAATPSCRKAAPVEEVTKVISYSSPESEPFGPGMKVNPVGLVESLIWAEEFRIEHLARSI